MNNSSKKNRNASSSAFGWDFQTNAAIVLFVKNIQKADKIKVEGFKEDIEIYLNNNKNIYIQAKSSITPYKDNNTIKKLYNSLDSLSDADDEKSDLIYVSNLYDPLKSNKELFNRMSNVKYSELPEDSKEIVKKGLTKKQIKNFTLDNFYIYTIPFFGENKDNRYKEIKEVIKEFLYEVGLGSYGYAQTVMENWQNTFFNNATNKVAKISKKDFIWPIVVVLCEDQSYDWLKDEYDESEISDTVKMYKYVINKASEKFTAITKVFSDYDSYYKSSENQVVGKDKIKSFINKYYTNNYFNLGDIRAESKIKDLLSKLIIYKILVKRNSILNIKKEVNL